MKALSLFIFILSLFSQDTMAAIFGANRIPYREICSNIHSTFQASPGSEICNDVISQYSEAPQFAFNICEDIVNKYRTNPDEGRSYCISQMRDINSEETPSVLLPAMSNIKMRGRPSHHVRQSMAMEQCEQSTVDDFTCRIDTQIIPLDLNSILSPLRALPLSVPAAEQNFSEAECNCLENSVEKSHRALSTNTLENSLNIERKRINDLIFNAAGKKLINDFASNLEDVNFYLTNNVTAIGGNSNTAGLQCNDFAAIQTKINQTCAANGVLPNVRNERMTKLLNAFGDFSNAGSPEEIFTQMQFNIMNYQLDPTRVFPGRSNTFTRQEYDRFRFGVYKSQPQVTFINDITDRIFDDESLGPRLLASIQGGKKPGHAIFEILKDKTNPDTQRILNQFLESHKDHSFYRNLKASLNANNPDALKTFIVETFDVAMDMHPSLKAVLQDTNLFLNTREQMHISGNHSLIETLDSSRSQLAGHFREKCEKMKNDFAAAACVPNDDFMLLTDRTDLNRLLSEVHDQLNPALKDLLLCRMPSTPAAPSLFSRLTFNTLDRMNLADYYLMKVNPTEKGATRFSQIAYGFQGGDERTFRELNQIAASGDEFRVPASSSTEGVASAEAAVKENSLLNSLAQTSYETQENRTPETPLANYIPPVLPQVPASTEVQNNSTDARSALRDFLANKENEEEVDQLLNQTNSKDHEELLRLRQELATNRSRMTALFQENEQRKLAALQESFKNLEREVTADAAPPVGQESSSNSQSAGGVQASAAIAETQVQSRNIASAAPSSNSSGSAGGTAGTSSGVNRTIASDESEAATSGAGFNADGGAIIIEAGTIQGNGTAGGEDINAEVISYLQEAQPDIATLRQLKESGVILKFRVLEDGREVLKEMRVEYALLSPEARQLLERKITQQERTQELNAARRAYSFSALKHLLGIRSQSQN